jgi:hypothetical protein
VRWWQRVSWVELAGELMAPSRARATAEGRPVIVGVDGRQGSGKTAAAEALAAAVPGAVVVRTDDVAWWESFFAWDHLLAAGVLVPLRRGKDVSYRPPAWDRRDRPGAIEVLATAPLVVVEGVGVARRGLATLLDATVWVQADHDEATRRGIARDGGTPEAAAFWQEWAVEEERFLAADRPWERATVTLCGTPGLLDPMTVLGALSGAEKGSTALRALPEPASIADGACRC